MANYLYNGVELPEIPKYDSVKYPYATIWLKDNLFSADKYLFGCCSKPAKKAPSTIEFYPAYDPGEGMICSIPVDGTEWSEFSMMNTEGQSEGFDASLGNNGYILWANHDVYDYNDKSKLHLAASDPVPVGGEPTTRTEWQKQDAYKPNTEWNGKTFYRVMGGKWVKQDVVVAKNVNWLTFSSAEPFTIGVNNATKNWDGTLYYSTDTTTWSEWDGTAAIASAEYEGEQRVYMRGSGNSVITGEKRNSNNELLIHRFVLTGNNIKCNGNIENLLDFETVAKGEHPVMGKYCYAFMFRSCTSLVTAPELPATALAFCCYYDMFYGCTALTTAPELPATTLANYCYCDMFYGCTALTTAPELPATTLANYCYYYMFYGCTALTTAPELPATTLANYCYGNMFFGCTSLVTAPKLPANTLANHCYQWMFYGCTSLVTAPELPATTSAEYCYAYMFFGCKSLVTAPELPATTSAPYCYYQMFRGCTSLVTAPKLPATTLAEYCYAYMFDGCTSIKVSKTQSDEYPNEYRIPTDGTGNTASNALYYMFYGTGGTFKGTPSINTTYYTANEVV